MHPNTKHPRARRIQESGYSHRTLAEVVGVGFRTVRRWAAGSRVIQAADLAIRSTLDGKPMTVAEAAEKLEEIYDNYMYMRAKK